jgi:hypothetical protein
VTDDEGGFSAGAVINFIEVDRNVRFEISLVAADRAGLKIDSALLSVASRVERPAAVLAAAGQRPLGRSTGAAMSARVVRAIGGMLASALCMGAVAQAQLMANNNDPLTHSAACRSRNSRASRSLRYPRIRRICRAHRHRST